MGHFDGAIDNRAMTEPKLIHRFGLWGGAECGATGKLRLSNSGVGVTCPECKEGR